MDREDRDGIFSDMEDQPDTSANGAKQLTNEDLYNEQMELLDTFLKNGAISQAQYDRSAEGLKTKMKR